MIIGFDAKRANANFTGLGNYSRFMVDTMATYGDEHKYRMYIPKQCKNASYDSLLKHKKCLFHIASFFRYETFQGFVENLFY